MKVCIIGDIHWSTYSSILRTRGKYFSTRLEYLIQSLSWVEMISKKYNCEEEIFLGDFFDKPDLTSEEITALSEVEWNNSTRIKHFIVGNHESGVASLMYNSTQTLYKLGSIENIPWMYPVDDGTEFLFLPYITEDNRKPLSEYMKNRVKEKKLIVFSHNDIKDFQMGQFVSKTGFEISDIEANCDLYINGHLHNGGWVSDKILNLGNLCGQNFSEDASRYEHHIAILDTDTLSIEFIKNPFALNFYKLTIEKESDIGKLEFLKENPVMSIKCEYSLKDKLQEVLEKYINLLCFKITYFTNEKVTVLTESQGPKIHAGDHLEKFKKFVLDNLGSSKVVISELSEVCK